MISYYTSASSSSCAPSWSNWSPYSSCTSECGGCGKPVATRNCTINEDCPEQECQGDFKKINNDTTCDAAYNIACKAPKSLCCEGYRVVIDRSSTNPKITCVFGNVTLRDKRKRKVIKHYQL
uniref:TIL domain-containing protein n=1 Tax=Parastrongyloides trichosuri TaxID=131310 RepID=A0A0N4ZDQ9_PARTI